MTGQWKAENKVVQFQQLEVVNNERGYRVTGSPDLVSDKWPLVEVFVCEHSRRYSRKRGGVGWHWRLLLPGPPRDEIVHQAHMAAQAPEATP